jgi:hypothetical protein
MDEVPVKRPVLTMPPEEAAALVRHYAAAEVILEYGTGGSTVVAAELPGKTVFAVESDLKWLGDMRAYFAANPPMADLHLHHGRIGRTKGWGYPQSEEHFRKWPGYPLAVWDLAEFRHPDVVLIDGRFRAACFLTTLFRITRPVTVLWDDYIDRRQYHEVETLVKPAEMIGRMARFDLKPMAIPAAKLPWIIETYLRPM